MSQAIPSYNIEVTEHDLPLPCLPSGVEGCRLVQMSDFHCGCGGTSNLIREAVCRANALEPDIVALTGDFVDHYEHDVPRIVEMLSELRARRGIFASLGNHDHRGAADLLLASLAASGITVLNNRAVEVAPGFWIAGVDELRDGDPDVDGTVAQIPHGAAAVLLAHHPDTLDLVPADRPLVLLAGHTHGGQIVLPYPTPAMICKAHLGTRFVHGWYSRGQARMYVNRGIGVTGGWPLNRRFRCPPEISVFNLRSADPYPDLR